MGPRHQLYLEYKKKRKKRNIKWNKLIFFSHRLNKMMVKSKCLVKINAANTKERNKTSIIK